MIVVNSSFLPSEIINFFFSCRSALGKSTTTWIVPLFLRVIGYSHKDPFVRSR